MKFRTLPLLACAVVFAVTVGCKKSPPAPKHDAHAEHQGHAEGHDHAEHMKAMEGDGAAAASTQAAGPKIETGSFLLEVSPTQATHTAGAPAELEIALESRGKWHVNEEYPIRIDLKAAPDVAVPNAELVKGDAAEFGEEKVRFVTAVEPTKAGEHEVTCDVSFALCTEENCILEKRTLAMTLEVE